MPWAQDIDAFTLPPPKNPIPERGYIPIGVPQLFSSWNPYLDIYSLGKDLEQDSWMGVPWEISLLIWVTPTFGGGSTEEWRLSQGSPVQRVLSAALFNLQNLCSKTEHQFLFMPPEVIFATPRQQAKNSFIAIAWEAISQIPPFPRHSQLPYRYCTATDHMCIRMHDTLRKAVDST